MSSFKKMISSKFAAPFKPRYGPGGRHSQSGITATVFGGTGFLGRYVIGQLGQRGSLVYIPYRGCEMEVRHLNQMFDHGQVGMMPYSPRDEASIYEAVKNSDLVINLIGKDYETKHLVPTRRADGSISNTNYGYDDTLVNIPQTIARISREAGVKAFIHMSALSANPNSKSKWARCKARGEEVVRQEFSDAIIIRPSDVFGHEDKFLNYIGTASSILPFVPLTSYGQTLCQPVHSSDIGVAVNRIINGHKEFAGKTFELAGPDVYTHREVVEFVADLTTVRTDMLNVPYPILSMIAELIDYTIEPFINRDKLIRLTEDNILKPSNSPDVLNFDALDIVPASMEDHAFDYMHRFRPGGHFRLVEGYYDTNEKEKIQASK
mmetsp:Transcript_24733/g.41825  ORF Transcript_24733/g.41825 Transcript_24733/m.41825 type:complete len:378 (-) Transcript_24733:283-1416(-)